VQLQHPIRTVKGSAAWPTTRAYTHNAAVSAVEIAQNAAIVGKSPTRLPDFTHRPGADAIILNPTAIFTIDLGVGSGIDRNWFMARLRHIVSPV
jgi:hypothetical protein